MTATSPVSDLEISIDKQVFRLHHAIVWARCKWLQARLAERWASGGGKKDRVELTSFSTESFACVIEYLYTGCHFSRYISLSILLLVCICRRIFLFVSLLDFSVSLCMHSPLSHCDSLRAGEQRYRRTLRWTF